MTVGGPARAVEIDGRTVTLTNLEKVLWPTLGLPKAWLVSYYADMADTILPYLRDHPVTLHRFPDGTRATHWYQTRAPAHPEWVRTMVMRPKRTGKVFDVVVVDDRASLLWAANLGTIEFHPFLGRVSSIDCPDAVVFDLDPAAGVEPATTAWVALRLRTLLDGLGLASFVKTTGGVGLHVVVPLSEPHDYDTTKTFARAIAELLREDHPNEITTTMARHARAGKVFVDWSQNDAGKSTVAPYSLRGYDVPTVATPVAWDEVAQAADGRMAALPITAADVLDRVAEHGDLFAPTLTLRQRLPDG